MTVMPAHSASSGTCGKNLTWTLDNSGTLTISGTGNMNDYSYLASSGSYNMPWFSQSPYIKTVKIGNGVTSIGNRAFSGCDLTSITIPNSVTSIGDGAFNGCMYLTSITAQNVISIGEAAFSWCSRLSTITIPNATSVGQSAFNNTAWLNNKPDGLVYVGKVVYQYKGKMPANTKIVLADGTVNITDYAFLGCENLTSITIPNSVTSIGNLAFKGCKNLTSISIPNVTSIGDSAFSSCSKLTSIEISKIVGIGSYAFENCKNLTSITAPNVANIGSYAFENCENLTSITVPNVTNIGSYAFENCRNLTSITIPNVTNIGVRSFSNCSSLTTIEMQKVRYIDNFAFSGCSMKSIIVPSSVTNIGLGAFSGCNGLESIVVPFVGDKLHTVSDAYQYPFGYIFGSTVSSDPDGTIQYYYGNSSITSSKYCIPSSLKTVIITGSEHIPYGAFYNCSNIEIINIPDSVKSIGDNAFYGCSVLKKIEVSPDNSYYSSSNGILYNKDKSEFIYIPEGLRSKITVNFVDYLGNELREADTVLVSPNGSYTYNTPQIEHYYTNDETISGTLTDGDKTITVVYYEKEILSSGSCGSNITWKLYGDGDLIIKGTGDMPDYSLTTAPWYANASSVKNIYIESGVTKIGRYAFYGCTNLSYINMGVGIKTIGTYAFGNCSKIKNINLPDSLTSIQDGAFWECTAISEIDIPKNLTSIGEKAFYGCSSLIKLKLGASVKSIANQAFDNCPSLTGVYFSGDPLASHGSTIFGQTSSGVVVYYYPTKLAWDSAITDGIHYLGYNTFPIGSVKQQTDDSNSAIPADSIYYIKVIDEYNNPINNAAVSFGGQQTKFTNAFGMVYLTKPQQAVNLSISKDKYSPYSDTSYIASKSQIMDIITLSTKPSVVKGVSCDGNSIASSVYTLNCNKKETASIIVSGCVFDDKKSIVKYELLQGNRSISTIRTSENMCTFAVNKKSFTEGENVLVKMYTSDGNSVSSALNIDVVSLADISSSQILDELSSLQLALNLGEFGKVTLPINFNKDSKSKIYTSVSGRTITVGINLDVNNLIKTANAPNNATLRKYLEKKVDTSLKTDAKTVSGIKYKVCGYLEIEYLGNGQYYVKTNYVKVSVSANLAFNAHASWAGVVGVYFKASLGADASLALKITQYAPETGFALNSAVVSVNNRLGVEAGAYILWGFGSAGVYGNLDMGFDLQLVPKAEFEKVYIKGELGARWSLFWGMVNGSHQFCSGYLYRWPDVRMLALKASEELGSAYGDVGNYSINSREYLKDRSGWLSEQKTRKRSVDIEEYFDLQTNAYVNIEPKVVASQNATVMVWLDDDASRNVDNFQVLCYSVYDAENNIWSAPKQLDNNRTLDCEFDLLTNGNDIYVIYTEQKDELSGVENLDISNAEDVYEFFGSTEIAFAKFENGEFTKPEYLTDNNLFETAPKLSFTNNKICATWVVTGNIGIANSDKKDSIYYSEYANDKWTEPILLANNQNSVLEASSGMLDNVKYSAYVVDSDNDKSTSNDFSLVLIDEQNQSYILDSGTISQISFVKVANREALMWLSGGKVYYTFDADDIIDAFADTEISTKEYKVLNSFGKTFLTFVLPAGQEQEETVAIWIDVNGAKSGIIHIAKANGYIENYDAVSVADKFLIAFNETNSLFSNELVSTNANLRYMIYHFANDIVLNSIDYDPDSICAGEEVDFQAEIKNDSFIDVDCLSVKLYDAENNIVSERQLAETLSFGETKTIDFNLVMPESMESDEYTLEVTAENGVIEKTVSNNSLPIQVKNIDLSVEIEQKIINDKNSLFVIAKNDGNISASAVLTLYAGDEEGRVIDIKETEQIAKNSPQQYYIELDGLIEDSEQVVTALITANGNDIHLTNNKDSVKLFKVYAESYLSAEQESIENPALSENYIKYDKYTDNEISIEITDGGNYFKEIEGLNSGTDYTIVNNIITFKKAYLDTLSGRNILNIVFEFDVNNQVVRPLTLDVCNSEPIAITGQLKADKNFVVGETVTADTSEILPTDANLSYEWTLDGEVVGHDAIYEIPINAINKVLALAVNGIDGYVGQLSYSKIISKKSPSTPNTPIIQSITDTAVRVVKLQGVEYSLDNETWRDDGFFNDLTKETQYNIYARYKETESSYASDIIFATVTTLSDENPILSQEFIKYDIYADNEISVEITNCGSFFKEITGLNKGTDYTFANNTITIKKTYLDTLLGEKILNVIFDFYGEKTVVRSLILDVCNSEPIAITGQLKADKKFVLGETVTADISDVLPVGANLSYEWMLDGETVGNSPTYEIPLNANNKVLTLTIIGTDGYSGELSYSDTIEKKVQLDPNIPKIESVTNTTIVLEKLQGVEYSLNNVIWQDDGIFDNLSENTQYIVYVRHKETDILYPSNSVYITVKTLTGEEYDTILKAWDGSVANGFESGKGTEEDPYIVKTASQLAYLAQSVNGGNNYSGKFIKLANDIVLNTPDMFARDENGDITGAAEGKTPNEWTAIGQKRPYIFAGIFDGCNKEIRGVYINNSIANLQGLFGQCSNATVKNVGVTEGYICGCNYVGGIVGSNYIDVSGDTFTVSNCYNTCTIIGSEYYVGGVVGYNIASSSGSIATVNGCYNAGMIRGNKYAVGGVVGFNEASSSGSIAIVKNSYNIANITGSTHYVGGIIGYNWNGIVENSYNTGSIIGNSYIGGIVGGNYVGLSGGSVTICNCYNTGSIVGNSYIGGVAGSNDANNTNSIAIVENSYNIGGVKSRGYHTGGVVGRNYAKSYCMATVTNCYYLSDCASDGNDVAQSGVGTDIQGSRLEDVTDSTTCLTDAQMQQQASFIGFGFDTVWTMAGNPDYQYPEIIGFYHNGYILPHTETQVVKNGDSHNILVKLINIETARIIVVGYKNNKVLSVEILNNDNIHPITLIGDFDTFKVMAWESLSSLKPICEAETIPKSKWTIE